jgi:hypothetical protein
MTNKRNLIYFLFILLVLVLSGYLYFGVNNPKEATTITEIKLEMPIAAEMPIMDVLNFTIWSLVRNDKNQIIDTKYSTTTDIELQTKPYVLDISRNAKLSTVDEFYYYDSYTNKYSKSGKTIYTIGTIENGKFKGKTLFGVKNAGELGGDYLDSYLIYLEGNKYLRFTEDDSIFSLDQSIYPETVVFPDTHYILKKGAPEFMTVPSTSTSLTINNTKFYIVRNSCVVMEMLDGRYLNYDFQYPIVNEDNREQINFVLNNGKTNTELYSYVMTRCNYYCTSPTLENIKDDDISSSLYKIAGKTTDGENVYTYANPDNEILRKMYADKNTAAYFEVTDNYVNLDVSKYTYEQFLNYNPVLFWQDALGNWIRFTNTRFLPMAEKCKPVIYLYPESTATLNVQITPNGGFTKTIPQYPVGGWNVIADSKSVITDLLTGIKYPYLYWSGIGVNYPINYDLGWVVSKNDVSSFLDNKLPLLGLKGKEIDDFKEYWVPKLSVQNYYQIYFLTKGQIDKMDPLKISPVNPDSVIRVTLTAKGLDKEITVRPQILPKTPKRYGFTVVEWGGALLK